MTTNLHDKMLAAIDAYFSASDGTEAEVAENLLLDVRDEINKQHRKAQPAPVQEPVAWPCVIAEADFEQNTITLEMKCSDYKVGAGQHWLHTTPPIVAAPLAAQKPWAGLTEEDRKAAFESLPDMLDGFLKTWGWLHFSKAIEAKLKEKNHDH